MYRINSDSDDDVDNDDDNDDGDEDRGNVGDENEEDKDIMVDGMKHIVLRWSCKEKAIVAPSREKEANEKRRAENTKGKNVEGKTKWKSCGPQFWILRQRKFVCLFPIFVIK